MLFHKRLLEPEKPSHPRDIISNRGTASQMSRGDLWGFSQELSASTGGDPHLHGSKSGLPSFHICLDQVIERGILLLASRIGCSDSLNAKYHCLNITVTSIITVLFGRLNTVYEAREKRRNQVKEGGIGNVTIISLGKVNAKEIFPIFLTLLILSSMFSMPRVRLISPKVSKMYKNRRIKSLLKCSPINSYAIVTDNFFFS